MKRSSRSTLYQAYISPDGHTKLCLELQRDGIAKNSLFVVVSNPQLQFDHKEFEITLKQATNLLVKCNHDFSQFVADLLIVKDG